jgi:hypothetical protein
MTPLHKVTDTRIVQKFFLVSAVCDGVEIMRVRTEPKEKKMEDATEGLARTRGRRIDVRTIGADRVLVVAKRGTERKRVGASNRCAQREVW